MLKVGIFLPFESDHWFGIERFCNNLAQELRSSADIDIKLVRPPESLLRFGSFFGRRVLFTLWVRRHQFDVYHISDQSYSHLLQFLPNEKCLITCHDLEFWKKRNSKNGFIRNWIAKCLLNAKIIATPTKQVSDEVIRLKAHFHEQIQDITRVETIYNSVNNDFNPPQNKSGAKKNLIQFLQKRLSKLDNSSKLETNFDGPIFLNVANTQWPRKNFSFLIDVLETLIKAMPSAKLLQIGPEFTEEIKQKIRAANVSNHIINLGYLAQSEIISIYQAVDFCLIPSLYEGFGYPLLESIACETPFLASKIPVFEEVFPESEFLVDLDKDKWVTKLETILSNEQNQFQLIQSHKIHLEQYSPGLQARKYKNLYEQIHSII